VQNYSRKAHVSVQARGQHALDYAHDQQLRHHVSTELGKHSLADAERLIHVADPQCHVHWRARNSPDRRWHKDRWASGTKLIMANLRK